MMCTRSLVHHKEESNIEEGGEVRNKITT